ncbi:MAG: transposase [Hormoscilla sp. GM102CHS1]|nr:transposase [Hormoscilla sp. GM102CHS1]
MEGIEELSVARGARVEYLPPYSPDFNPIEMLWWSECSQHEQCRRENS